MTRPPKARRWALVIACSLLAAGVAVFVFQPIDGYGGWVLSVLADKEDTVYATGYSDEAFRRIRPGMSEQEVADLLGAPLEKYSFEGDDGVERVGWRYSKSAHGQSYRIRAVVFDEGRVMTVFREFYLD